VFSIESYKSLLICLPVFVYNNYDCDEVGLFMKAISRMIRIDHLRIFTQSGDKGDADSIVKDKV